MSNAYIHGYSYEAKRPHGGWSFRVALAMCGRTCGAHRPPMRRAPAAQPIKAIYLKIVTISRDLMPLTHVHVVCFSTHCDLYCLGGVQQLCCHLWLVLRPCSYRRRQTLAVVNDRSCVHDYSNGHVSTYVLHVCQKSKVSNAKSDSTLY